MARGRRSLIVTADDFGLTHKVNEAIAKAHREGIVTSASLMANGGALDSAIAILKGNPELDVGLHLNLTEGHPVSVPSQIPSLADSSGFLNRHPFELAAGLFRGRVQASDVEREIRGQFERAFAAGANVTHFDGHKHVHVLPAVLRIACRVAPDYGIKAVRATVERTPRLISLISRNSGSMLQILKQYVFGKALSAVWLLWQSAAPLNRPERLYGITQTGFLDATTLAEIVGGLQNGVSEIMCHPGYVDEELMRTPTRLRGQREHEVEALTQPRIRNLLRQEGVELISYRDLLHRGIRS